MPERRTSAAGAARFWLTAVLASSPVVCSPWNLLAACSPWNLCAGSRQHLLLDVPMQLDPLKAVGHIAGVPSLKKPSPDL